jgi:hypothetical protein
MTPATQNPQQQPEGHADPSSEPESQHDLLLREIAEDARREPERYLADSVVPRGGE